MKKYIKSLVVGIFASFLIVACNFTEEMTIEPDGSGRMSINFDGSALMEMAGDKIAENGEVKKMDSIIDFAQFLEEKKDSIAKLSPEKQERIKQLENFKMKIAMDSEAKKMDFAMFTEFKNVNELGDMMSNFQEASAVQKPGGGMAPDKSPMGKGTQGTDVSYSLVGNSFKRITTIVDQELFEQSVDSLEQVQMFLGESTYTLNYHFPRKIKSTSAKEALFSQDGKSLTLEVSFMDLMANPKVLDVEVELEK